MRYLPDARASRNTAEWLTQRRVCVNRVCVAPAFWIASLLTELAFRPRPSLLANELFRSDAASGLATFVRDHQGPVIGMHIRRTDKIKGKLAEARLESRSLTIAQYFEHADAIAAGWRYQPHLKPIEFDGSSYLPEPGIYVAADSARTVKKVLAHHSAGRRQLFVDRAMRQYEQGTILSLREGIEAVDVRTEAINAIRDIWLLAAGDAFVGTMSSFFGRVAWLLMFASGRMLAFKTLDRDPWGDFPDGPSYCFPVRSTAECVFARYSRVRSPTAMRMPSRVADGDAVGLGFTKMI